MTTNSTTRKSRRLRGTIRDIWDDSVRAHRAMARLTPYFDEQRQDGR
ncbi:hypothetical protein [Nocardioides cynanchi]|nr:hypothetical protein [Nocardioides cynanchi]